MRTGAAHRWYRSVFWQFASWSFRVFWASCFSWASIVLLSSERSSGCVVQVLLASAGKSSDFNFFPCLHMSPGGESHLRAATERGSVGNVRQGIPAARTSSLSPQGLPRRSRSDRVTLPWRGGHTLARRGSKLGSRRGARTPQPGATDAPACKLTQLCLRVRRQWPVELAAGLRRIHPLYLEGNSLDWGRVSFCLSLCTLPHLVSASCISNQSNCLRPTLTIAPAQSSASTSPSL